VPSAFERSRPITTLRPERIAELIRPFRVEPGRKVQLSRDFDPGFTAGFVRDDVADDLVSASIKLLAEYQDRLAAQDTHSVLVVLQAMDAAGKDGTIKHVMSGVNPQGVEVHSFKAPSPEELDHDYLWRFNRKLPQRGHIGIFNRSHYEEVLVVRVHPAILAGQKLPAKMKGQDVWERRYREINDWERYLTDQGVRVVKMFLNLSREEQRRRFLARIDQAEKNWKFSADDVKERAYWDDYQAAFSAMLSATSTAWAPWHVIPADHKWFARIAAASIIAHALIEVDPRYPEVSPAARQALQAAKVDLMAQAPEGAAADPNEAKRARDLESPTTAGSDQGDAESKGSSKGKNKTYKKDKPKGKRKR
jgi:PPK2 family polyphosphate:nucleotide phosphotransferase